MKCKENNILDSNTTIHIVLSFHVAFLYLYMYSLITIAGSALQNKSPVLTSNYIEKPYFAQNYQIIKTLRNKWM